MDACGVAGLIGALAKLLGATLWPGLLGLALVLFRPELREFLRKLNRISVVRGDSRIILETQVEAAALVAGADLAADARAPGSGRETALRASAGAASRAIDAVGGLTATTLGRIRRASVLWVDDQPQNNILERRALEVLGASVTTALTTEEALGRLAATGYRLVISDMGRPPDQRAGYTLLDAMRARGERTPVVFYAGSATAGQQAEAGAHGASGQASDAVRLFEIVVPLLHG